MDSTRSPYFEIFYFYEALTNLYMGYSYASSDLLFACTSTLMAGQMRILGIIMILKGSI